MRLPRVGLTASIAALLLAACAPTGQPTGSPAGDPPGQPTQGASPTGHVASPIATVGGALTIYSGRTEDLIGPLIAQFEADTGIDTDVRYADTAELAVLLTEEGANTPADVFLAQDAGALGAVADERLLAVLPDELLERVAAALRSPAGEWVGISGRARVLAYDSRELEPANLPESVDELTNEEWRGRIGWAPTNGSFQAFVTAYRLLRGDDAAREWLTGMLQNEPVRYEGNTPIVQAIADGEIDVGLVNHYYALRQRAEQGEDFPTRNHFFSGDDPGALINVAGLGILEPSDNQAAAQHFVDYLLNPGAQAYFAEETFEYPLVEGVEPPEGTPPLEQLSTPEIDLSDLSDLEGTLRLLNEVGVLP